MSEKIIRITKTIITTKKITKIIKTEITIMRTTITIVDKKSSTPTNIKFVGVLLYTSKAVIKQYTAIQNLYVKEDRTYTS